MPERGERGKPELSGRVDRLSRPIGLFGYFVCLTDSFALLTQSGIEPLGFNLQLITMRSRVRDLLLRLDGVGDLILFGEREFALRIWIDPEKLSAYGLAEIGRAH